MDKFTPLQYVKIACANFFGLDKKTWQERIDWFDQNHSSIDSNAADLPILFRKGLRAYSDAMNGIPSRFIMDLDATASGLQIMSAISRDVEAMKMVNVISTTERSDAYTKMAELMTAAGFPCDRGIIKDPLMT